VSAPSLLGFPVTQGGLAEIHAPYLSLFGEMKIPKKNKKERRSSGRGVRARHSNFNDQPCSQGTLERRWTCVNGVIGGCLAQNSRDMFGDDIYWSPIFGSALLNEKVWLGRSHGNVMVERSRSRCGAPT